MQGFLKLFFVCTLVDSYIANAETESGGTDSQNAKQGGYISPESTTLPLNVARFRFVYGQSESTFGYDNSGKKVESGLKLNGAGGAAVIEYGVSKRLGVQFLVPLTKGANISVNNKEKFKSSSIQPEVARQVGDVFTKILANPTVGGLYNSGGTAPVDIAISDELVIPAGANVKSFLDQAKAQKIVSETEAAYSSAKDSVEDTQFDKGIGDIEIGAKYSISTVDDPFCPGLPLYFSVAGGLRLNSSGYKKAVENGLVPNGRGTTDFGLRLNADYDFTRGVQLQVENQTEFMVLKGRTYSSSGKEVDYARSGAREIGYVKLVVAPGAWASELDMIRFSGKYGYDLDAKTKTDGKTQTDPAARGQSATFGLSYDGLTQGVPLQVDFDIVKPIAGKARQFASSNNILTLKTFYQF